MRKEIIALALGISFGATAWAQLPNLLEGCFTDAEAQMDNSASFFSVWDCFYDDGKPLPPELQPNSVFSKIYASGNALYFHYEEKPRNVPGDLSNGFAADMPVVILDFPTNLYPYDFSNLSFSYPISVPEDGLYHLSGSAISLSARNLNGQPKSFVNTASMLVFVADKTPGLKTMTVEQDGDTNYLAVRNTNQEMLSCAYTPIPSYKPGINTQPFHVTLNLTKDTRYLSIFGPMQQIMLGNLKLVPDKIPATLNEIGDAEIESENMTQVYTLQGTKTTLENARKEKGIYVITDGNKVSKMVF